MICKICKEDKPVQEFYKSNKSSCKECVKIRNRSQDHTAKDRTEKGVVRVLFKTMKRHQRLRGHGELPFTKQDFIIWLENTNFKTLYNKWVKAVYEKDLKPSVDRLDDFHGYSFENMRLVTWKDNHEHQICDILEGKGTSGKRCKSLGKFNKEGELLSTYVSYQDVRRKEGYCVHYPVKNKRPCKKGYLWKEIC